MIDTAAAYGNEEAVGNAIQRSGVVPKMPIGMEKVSNGPVPRRVDEHNEEKAKCKRVH